MTVSIHLLFFGHFLEGLGESACSDTAAIVADVGAVVVNL
jgi:hypothetical protein